MKHIHMKKPDIKGFFQKIRNLKMQDIKEHFKERKERRRQILEKRRNGKFARKMQPVYRMTFISTSLPVGMCLKLHHRDHIQAFPV